MITLMVTEPANVEATTFLGPMAPSPHRRAGPISKSGDDTGVGLKALRWLRAAASPITGRDPIPNPVMTPGSDLKLCDG